MQIHGVAIFLEKFVLVHEREFSIKLAIQNMSTGVSSQGHIHFKQNSEAGIHKVWGDQMLEAGEGQCIKVEIELVDKVDSATENRLMGFVRNLEDKRKENELYQNEPRVFFTRKTPRLVGGINFSRNAT